MLWISHISHCSQRRGSGEDHLGGELRILSSSLGHSQSIVVSLENFAANGCSLLISVRMGVQSGRGLVGIFKMSMEFLVHL